MTELVTLRPQAGAPLGVYIHFPFCLHRCPYCDFTVRVARTIPHEDYRDAVLAELERRAVGLEGRQLVSIYFGGGTPGLWRPDCVGAVIDAVRARWPLLADPEDEALARRAGDRDPVEVTVEINPARAPREHLEALRQVGVNRLSVGVQSFEEAYLRQLGRDHAPEQAVETLEAASQAGFSRLSFDLIHGGPGQTLEGQLGDLGRAAGLRQADHVSVYEMTIEPGTTFGVRYDKGLMEHTDEDTMARMYRQARGALEGAGWQHYEVGSYARPGRYARHNSLYWRGGEYLGLGVGAHEMRQAGGVVLRRANTRSLRSYMAQPGEEGSVEEVSAREHLFESVFLGLRTRYGVSAPDLEARFGPLGPRYLERCLERLQGGGWLLEEPAALEGAPAYLRPQGQRFGPSLRGMLQADLVAGLCLEVLETL